ncbi:hypothetical protein BDR05DRAFT_1035653, partial [Suillus weaverae]
NGLLHHLYLDTDNMIVDPGLHALCCHICQVALPPAHVSGHIENKHPTIKLDSKRYSEAVAEMNVPMTLPTSIAGRRDCSAYKGLLLSKGVHKRFWRVAGVEEMPNDYQEALDSMRKEMAEVTRVEQVLQDNALVLLDTTEELILQHLNSPDPSKDGINNSPLHRHQEDATMKSYIHTTIGLLAMLLRIDKGGDYDIPIPHNLMLTLQDLELALMTKKQTTEKIHAVLTKTWLAKRVKKEGNTIPCPTEQFMALHTLEADG